MNGSLQEWTSATARKSSREPTTSSSRAAAHPRSARFLECQPRVSQNRAASSASPTTSCARTPRPTAGKSILTTRRPGGTSRVRWARRPQSKQCCRLWRLQRHWFTNFSAFTSTVQCLFDNIAAQVGPEELLIDQLGSLAATTGPSLHPQPHGRSTKCGSPRQHPAIAVADADLSAGNAAGDPHRPSDSRRTNARSGQRLVSPVGDYAPRPDLTQKSASSPPKGAGYARK